MLHSHGMRPSTDLSETPPPKWWMLREQAQAQALLGLSPRLAVLHHDLCHGLYHCPLLCS